MRLFLLLALYLSPVYGDYTDEWIDPSDMLNYDAASGKMKNKPQVESTQSYYSVENTVSQVESTQSYYSVENTVLQDATKQPAQKANELHQNPDMTCSAEYQEYKIKLENLKGQLEETKRMEKSKSKSQAIFKRYLNKILIEAGRIGLPDESYPKAHYDAEVVLTMEMLEEIQSFLNNGDWNVGALDDALSSTLVQFKHHNEEEWKWKFEDSFGVDVYTLFMLILCVLCLVMLIATEIWTHIGWFTQLKRLLILSTVISFGWNWMYLYKVAFAERQAELAKLQDFDKCSQKISWSENLFETKEIFKNVDYLDKMEFTEDNLSIIRSFLDNGFPDNGSHTRTKMQCIFFIFNWMKGAATFQNDPCEDYFKALIVSPTLMVPPTKALALTFTNFITEPLKHIGKGIGEFLNALLSEIPLFFQVPVLIFIAVLLLAFFYGAGTAVMNPMNLFRRLTGPEREPVEPARPVQGGSHNQLPPGERCRDNNLPGPEREKPLPVEPARSKRKGFIEDVQVPPALGQLPRDNDVVNIPKQQPLDDIDGSNNQPVTAPADPSDTGQVKSNNTGKPLVQEDHSIKKSIKESRNDERPNTESPEAEPQRPEEPVVETLRST